MNYAFIFTGEFGYELFNWQGVIRKWILNHKKQNDKVIICSREGLESLYELADCYINISQLDSYNNTVADCYRGYIWEEKEDIPFDDWPIIGSGPKYDNLVSTIKKDVKTLTEKTFGKIDKWVWSCEYEKLDDCHFGHGGPGGGSIYSDGKFLENNIFSKIEINKLKNLKNLIQQKVSIDLNKPFVLCQTGYRGGAGYTNKSKVKINHNHIFQNNTLPVLYLNFNSGRYWDSTSSFETESYFCSNFSEQACLILLSTKCIFTTEGDFRSHTYIPPMLGKDVDVIASKEVLNLPSSSSNFWNKNIFKFGGQMFTYEYETFLN